MENKKIDRIVTTDTLFQTTKDYDSLNEKEKSEYINILAKEFLENADDLMKNLADE